MVSSPSFTLKSQVVRAGAGTGKTYNLINKIFEVYKDFAKHYQKEPRLIVCTFTRKATQELKERLYQAAIKEQNWDFLNYIGSPLFHVSTIDSLLRAFLSTYAPFYNLTPDFSIEDSTERGEILFDQLCEKHLFEKHTSLLEKMPFPYLQQLLRDYVKNRLKYGQIEFYNAQDFKNFEEEYEAIKNAEEKKKKKKKKEYPSESFDENLFLPLFKEFQSMAESFFKEYLKCKKDEGYLSYEDLNLLSLDLLREQPPLAQSFSKDWDYWFIDEYQDTSWVQEQIIEKITQFKNVYCVGDPQQSIYSFRGAEPHVFERRVQANPHVTDLDTNRRSQSGLIHFYNDFFPPDKGFLNIKPYEKSENSQKPSVTFLSSDKDNHLSSTCSFIKRLIDQGVEPKDIVILSSKNKHFDKLSSFLHEQGLNTFFSDKEQSLENRLVLDALFVLKFLMNPHDDINLISLLRTPYFYLEDREITLFCQKHKQKEKEEREPSLWLFLNSAKKDSSVDQIINVLNNYLQLSQEKGIVKTFEEILLKRGFMLLAHNQDSSGLSESLLHNLLFLLQKESSPLGLFYSLIEQKKSLKSKSFFDPNAIQLMSIHKSKGLEFEHVIIFDPSICTSDKSQEATSKDSNDSLYDKADNCIFDDQNKKMAFAVPQKGRQSDKIKSFGHKCYLDQLKEKKLNERDRLFYVAFTRAKQSLTVLIPQAKLTENSWILRRMSFFNTFKANQDQKEFILTSGIYKRASYSLEILENFNYNSQKKVSKSFANQIIQPYQSKSTSSFAVKSSQDFYEQPKSDLKKEKMIIPKIKNRFFKVNLGIWLHYYLHKLSQFPLKSVLSQLKQSFLSPDERKKIEQGLAYVSSLEEAHLKDFLKAGHSEWSFKYQADKVILQGQIDLWGKRDQKIWVFDYKSSLSQKAEKQLIFYSWVLSQIHKPQSITMCSVYPLEQEIKTYTYEQAHQQEMKDWLKQQNELL